MRLLSPGTASLGASSTIAPLCGEMRPRPVVLALQVDFTHGSGILPPLSLRRRPPGRRGP